MQDTSSRLMKENDAEQGSPAVREALSELSMRIEAIEASQVTVNAVLAQLQI